ncbi:MAG: hypothetical protein KME54_11960 [Tolypothrix brevis GSE-NOS-MK-07-07A]|nr:hypothetical protein [Tolypothrix brevis GSE-NOS-MK-07-07A]
MKSVVISPKGLFREMLFNKRIWLWLVVHITLPVTPIRSRDRAIADKTNILTTDLCDRYT